jgi:hypothetical protein
MKVEGWLLGWKDSIILTFLNQMNPFHNLPHFSFNIYFNIILQSKPVFSKTKPVYAIMNFTTCSTFSFTSSASISSS